MVSKKSSGFAARLDFGDQQLGRVVLDKAFLELILFDNAFAGRIENLFLERGMDRQLKADFVGQLLLAPVTARFFEVREQIRDLAVVLLSIARSRPAAWSRP